MWVVVALLIVLIGLRFWIGADYGNYFKAYNDFGKRLDVSDIFNIVVDGRQEIHMEWLYLLFANFIYELDLSFYAFTFF